MKFSHASAPRAVVAVAFVLCAISAPVFGAVVTYDPSLGTLPQAQGFGFIESGGASPAPTVSGGILHQGLTNFSGLQYWPRNDTSYDFNAGFTLELTLQVIHSTYDANASGPGSQRSGYYVDAVDQAGRRFALGIADTGVTVNTDASLSNGNGITFTPFNTTNGQHNYKLNVAAGIGSLFIDNNLIGTTPVGDIVDPGDPNFIYFGDGTGGGNSETQLSFLRYTGVPEPTSLGIAGVAFMAMLARRRSDR